MTGALVVSSSEQHLVAGLSRVVTNLMAMLCEAL